jgi:2-polyprenyl-6-methoxyphenol hydroxylase-like FAD-dependent oxidoreductase
VSILGIAPTTDPVFLDRVTQARSTHSLPQSNQIIVSHSSGAHGGPVGAQAVDGCHRVFTKPFADDTVMWQLTFPAPESLAADLCAAGPEAIRTEAQRRFGSWFAPYAALIPATPLSTMRCGAMYDRDPPAAWPTRLVTILGDAAHPMSPFKGQGANQALLDASSLARSLAAQPHNIRAAFAEYEAEMRSRVPPYVLGSRRNVVFYHTPAAITPAGVFAYAGIRGAEATAMVATVSAINRERFGDDRFALCLDDVTGDGSAAAD